MLFLGPPIWLILLLITSVEPVFTPRKPRCVEYSDHGLQVSFHKMWEIMRQGVDPQGFEEDWVTTGSIFQGKVLQTNEIPSINQS